MVALVSPGGTRVEAEENVADALKAQGWKPVGEDKPRRGRPPKKTDE
jgi:hypothetical protein